MDLALLVPLTAFGSDAKFLWVLGPAAEERRFESINAPEQVVIFDEYRSRYPYSADGKLDRLVEDSVAPAGES
jgi:hypothetical protein